MARFLKNRNASAGRAPGEMIFIGERKMEESTIKIIDYDGVNLVEQEIHDANEVIALKNTETVSWININGVHDKKLIESVGKAFDLHTLVLDDIVDTGQRPSVEDYDNYIFFTLKMMRYDEIEQKIESEQLSMVLGKSFLITFQERPGDVFEPIRDRIRKQKGRIRKVGIDYLAYALLDIIVENYIIIIERLGERIEDLENEILENPTREVLSRINDYKREMNYLRKSIRPARELILQFSRMDSDLIQENNLPFIKDLLDLSIQAVEVIDTYREMLSDYLEIYNTGVNNRLNEIMKVLTIFSAVFIPLTFIAGIYGTNFENLPELSFKYSYYIFWGVLVIIAISMLGFFKRKKWL